MVLLLRKYWWVFLIVFLVVLWAFGTIRDGDEWFTDNDPVVEDIEPTPIVVDESIEDIVHKVASKQFRGIEGITYDNGELIVEVLGKDTYSGSLSQKSILMSMSKLLKEIHKLEFDSINFLISLPFKDAYGNVSEDVVLKAKYNRETIDKINWDGFESSSLAIIADEYWMHDAIK